MRRCFRNGVLAALAALVAGCGTASTQLTAPSLPGAGVSPSPRTGSATTAPSSTTTTTVAPANHVGAAATLTGGGGLSTIVQVATVVDPSTAANSYDAPGAGMRFAAVRLALNDTGPVALNTNLLDDVTVIDATGATVTPIVLDMSDCPVIIGGEVALAPHAAVIVGCVAFELPTTDAVRAVHVAIAAGPGGQAAWSVP